MPPSVRAAVDVLAGSPIIRATNVEGGFSPGPAARCDLADGRRVFVQGLRTWAEHARFGNVPTRGGRVVGAVDRSINTTVDRLMIMESAWVEAVAGSALLHGELRSDNILISTEITYVVDWPAASIEARWVDLVRMLPSMHHDGAPPPAALFERHPVARGADPAVVDAYLCAILGDFTYQSLLPAPRACRRCDRSMRLKRPSVATGWHHAPAGSERAMPAMSSVLDRPARPPSSARWSMHFDHAASRMV